MKKLIMILSLIAMGFALKHEYYVSVFQLNYNKANKQVEVSLKVFTDDLEKMLKDRRYGILAVSNETHRTQIDLALEKEVKNGFHFRDKNNKEHELNVLGFEEEEDVTWVYFTVEKVRSLKEANLEVTWFTEIFPGQKNIIHFKNGGEELSEYLDIDNPQKTFTFGT
jgi:hypothetical protein